MRALAVALLGFVAGVGTTLWLVRSGAGDFAIRRTDAVQDLERQLRTAEIHRDQLGRQLEDVSARAARMEKAFSDLERRFHDMQGDGDAAHPN